MNHMLTDPAAIARFLVAGKATLTLTSAKTGAYFTYRVNCPADKAPETSPRFFVGVLSGPDNEADYRYLGMVEKTMNGMNFRLTKGSKIAADAPSAKAFAFFFDHVIRRATMPAQLKVRHEGAAAAARAP